MHFLQRYEASFQQLVGSSAEFGGSERKRTRKATTACTWWGWPYGEPGKNEGMTFHQEMRHLKREAGSESNTAQSSPPTLRALPTPHHKQSRGEGSRSTAPLFNLPTLMRSRQKGVRVEFMCVRPKAREGSTLPMAAIEGKRQIHCNLDKYHFQKGSRHPG